MLRVVILVETEDAPTGETYRNWDRKCLGHNCEGWEDVAEAINEEQVFGEVTNGRVKELEKAHLCLLDIVLHHECLVEIVENREDELSDVGCCHLEERVVEGDLLVVVELGGHFDLVL